ncbi:hypothetical protein ANCDUO_06783 [Ancylostoma duodenale]|uniref:HMG box n=1 Tax=Ancylostoma duodenale TaxID=51022 RepID=A0A0C2DK90_9BILA|nr:hypothetical protein ANCDUO_06783 [Ancylostoma duodenale]
MDLQRILQRLQARSYARWVDIVADLSLMLENACKYNEPESAIYKDAVALQRLVLEKKRELGAAEDCIPRVQMEIRTMFTNIFVAVFSKKGRYRRLDRFQKDFFDLFDRARELSRSDSKLFEDATELQLAFIQERDAQCKGVLISTAFTTIENDVLEAVEKLRKSKMHQEAEIHRRESNDQEIEKQVFITPFIDTVLAERLSGLCIVVSVKTALHNVVEGVNPSDLYVCECRYLGKPRYFAKIKTWPFPEEEEKLKLTPRSRPLSPVRVTSNFVNADGIADRDDDELPARTDGADADGRTYLYAMRTHSGKYHDVGRFVLVFNPQRPTCDVMRIDKLWREKDGSEWFSGGYLARPCDIQHDAGRMFYVRETSAEDENYDPLNGGAPMHIDSAKPLRKFKQYKGAHLPDAEVFIFKTPIVMEKEMSPLARNGSNGPSELDMELDENDTDGAESTASKSGVMSNWLAAQPKLTAKSKSGYILFSAEIRKRIMHENPDSGFGEVSKIVGIEWKKLSDDQKRQYEVRAEYIASERAKQEAARAASEKSLQEKHLATSMKNVYPNQIGRNFFKLATQPNTGGEAASSLVHIPYGRGIGGQTPQGAPAPQTPHVNGHANAIPPHLNGEHHYPKTIQSPMPQHQPPPTAQMTPQVAHQATPSCSQGPMVCRTPSSSMQPPITDAGRTVVKAQGAEPVFVAPPSSVHARRVLHSETYLRYIESLSSNRQRSVSKWDASLTTNPRNAQPNLHDRHRRTGSE